MLFPYFFICAVVPPNPWGALFLLHLWLRTNLLRRWMERHRVSHSACSYFGIFIVLDSLTVLVQKGCRSAIITTLRGEFVGLFKSETLLTFPALTFSLHVHLYFFSTIISLFSSQHPAEHLCLSWPVKRMLAAHYANHSVKCLSRWLMEAPV